VTSRSRNERVGCDPDLNDSDCVAKTDTLKRRDMIELRSTLENVNVPAVILNRGAVTWSNRAATSAFGEILGEPFASVVANEDASLVHRQLERKLHGLAFTDYEADVFTRDGKRRRAEISSVRIPDGNACSAIFGLVRPGPPEIESRHSTKLTHRQLEMLHLLAEGAATGDIAAQLHLSRETVRNHVRNIFRALGVHSRLEAVLLAYQTGLLKPTEASAGP
jgi:PAS domain S-box-containing protein